MMQEVFLFPLVTAFLFAVGAIFDKFILENKMTDSTAYFFLQLFVAVALFPFLSIVFFGLEIPGLFSMLLILFAEFVSNIGYLVYFYIAKRYDISSVGPIVQAKLLFAIPLAFIFLNEFYGIAELLLMLLIFAGAVLTTYSKQASFKELLLNNRLLFLAMVMSFAWALSDTPIKFVLTEISAPSFMYWRYIFDLPIILVFAFALFRGSAKEAFFKNLKRTLPFSVAAALIGFCGMLLLFMSYAFSYTIPSAFVLSQAVFVFALAFVISKVKSSLISEKEPSKVYAVRLVGVLLMISSIYFLIIGTVVL